MGKTILLKIDKSTKIFYKTEFALKYQVIMENWEGSATHIYPFFLSFPIFAISDVITEAHHLKFVNFMIIIC